MMENPTLFSFANSFVLIGWLMLLIVPNWKHTKVIVVSGVVLVLALLYSFLLFTDLAGSDFQLESFSSLEGVVLLFQNDRAVLIGWIHYLAFDLLVGNYIVEKSKTNGIPRWALTIILPFTFMFGPLGYLLYQLTLLLKRTVSKK